MQVDFWGTKSREVFPPDLLPTQKQTLKKSLQALKKQVCIQIYTPWISVKDIQSKSLFWELWFRPGRGEEQERKEEGDDKSEKK